MKANEIEKIVQATIEAMDKYGGDIGFMESVKRFNLGEERLELWVNAYEEAAMSGIRALVETFPMDQQTAKDALKQIQDFFQVTWPSREYRLTRRYNTLTVSIKDNIEEEFRYFFQLRYTPFDGKWHVYWIRNSGKWCPYVPDEEDGEGLLWKKLYLIRLDQFGCFV